MELANACIESMDQIVSETPNLAQLLDLLKRDDSTYRYRHSLMTNYIGSHIIKKMEWGSHEQQKKLSFVCFFHDISLRSDEEAKIHNERQILESDLPEERRDFVRNHALISAKVVNKIKRAPLGADTIIKQHHGHRNGEGFRDFYPGVSPLAIVFILAESWVELILMSEDKEGSLDKDKVLAFLKQKYPYSSFDKIIQAFIAWKSKLAELIALWRFELCLFELAWLGEQPEAS